MRFFTVLVGLLLASLCSITTAENNFPSRAITIIVPFTAGGQTDIEVRSLAHVASQILGQPIIVQNKPGAVGSLGAATLKTAAPNGYLLSSIPLGVFRQPHITKMSYDPTSDLTYILGTSGYTMGFVVRADSPWQSLEELLTYAKANPGKVTYATLGVGSTQHQVTDRLGREKGIDWLHIPYKGSAENNIALQGKQVDFIADGNGWAGLVDGGEFRLLSIWSDERNPRWPEVPTLKELGYDIVEMSSYGIAGPKNMSPEVVKTLHDAFKTALLSPQHQKTLLQLGQPTVYMTSQEFTDYAHKQYELQKEVVERFGLAANK